jgi:hypothetical protein
MVVTQAELRGRIAPILGMVAEKVGRNSIAIGDAAGAAAAMRVELEENVSRLVQVYWTPFQADIPGISVGLHLEIAEPKVHWVEAYISPTKASWVFAFHERSDGDMQLAYYQQHEHAEKAVEAFFDIASWYALTPTDKTWDDVTCQISPDVGWGDTLEVRASSGPEMDKAIQEALKKSTILWLRWSDDGGEKRTMPVWFIYYQDKIYVLSGERQQTIPGAESLRECDVIVRWKGRNAQVAELYASVRVLPQGPEWDELAERIAEKRLNIPGLPEDTARRWRDECHILELTLR